MTLKSSVGSLAKSSQKTTPVGISDVETIHPWKLIRKLKMDGWKQPSIFRFHVSFQGCIKSTSPIFRGYVSFREGYCASRHPSLLSGGNLGAPGGEGLNPVLAFPEISCKCHLRKHQEIEPGIWTDKFEGENSDFHSWDRWIHRSR